MMVPSKKQRKRVLFINNTHTREQINDNTYPSSHDPSRSFPSPGLQLQGVLLGAGRAVPEEGHVLAPSLRRVDANSAVATGGFRSLQRAVGQNRRYPGHQNRWYMGGDSPQNGGIGYDPWPNGWV